MRIGIDLRCLAEGKRTGVDEYTRKTLVWLFENNQEDEFFLFFNAWKKEVPDFAWATRYPHVSVKVFRFPNKLLNLSLWYLRYPHLDTLLGGVEVYFVPNINFVAVSRGTRLVVTAHDLSFEYFPEAFSWKQRFWHYMIDFRGLLRRADAIVAVSHSTKADLEAVYNISPEKITVVHSGIDREFYPQSRNSTETVAVKEKYALPYTFILSLGTFEPRKNTLATLRAFEAFHAVFPRVARDTHLVLAGAYGWKSEELRQAVIHSPVRKYIHPIGYVAPEDKAALYTLASVFVYPSFYEGFGFPPLEALACGTPVITSHSSSLPEVVGDAALLIDPYRPDQITEGLAALLSNSEYRSIYVEKGKVQAARFHWNQTAKQTSCVLKQEVYNKKVSV
jgi:glycosyltransferase involved in cell wall biosynthesis